jgi:hypothetical protein
MTIQPEAGSGGSTNRVCSVRFGRLRPYIIGSGNPDIIPSVPVCNTLLLRPLVYTKIRDLVDGPKVDTSTTGGPGPVSKASRTKDYSQ